MPPRAALTISTPGLTSRSSRSPIRPEVSAVFGRCTLMKSASREQVLQADEADAELGRPRRGHVGVVGDHLHAERGQPLGDQLADPAEAEDPGHLPVELGAGELGPLPLPGLERGHRLRHVAGDREQQPHGVLGGADDVRAGRVHHHDARLGGGLDVDVVQPDAGPRHHPQVRRLRPAPRRRSWSRSGRSPRPRPRARAAARRGRHRPRGGPRTPDSSWAIAGG